MGTMPVAMQEIALIQDLLYVLLVGAPKWEDALILSQKGLDAKYVRKVPAYMATILCLKSLEQPLFTIDASLGKHLTQSLCFHVITPLTDPSLTALAHRFLPMATYYAFLSHTTEEAMAFHHGFVVHAMAAQTRQFLHDYHLFVAHLETQSTRSDQSIGLQQWWSWSVDVSRIMRALAEIWHNIVFHSGNPEGESGRWLRGGEALNVLFRFMTLQGGYVCYELICY